MLNSPHVSLALCILGVAVDIGRLVAARTALVLTAEIMVVEFWGEPSWCGRRCCGRKDRSEEKRDNLYCSVLLCIVLLCTAVYQCHVSEAREVFDTLQIAYSDDMLIFSYVLFCTHKLQYNILMYLTPAITVQRIPHP